MATIRSYTTIKQSRKLAEILPIDSADCYWEDDMSVEFGHGWHSQHFPCWSIGALIDILPRMINHETLFIEASPSLWHVGYRGKYTARSVNLIDACYEIVLYLHELNLL